ncbi:hypothetical protein ACFSO7_01325 [Bacillus sp. CGMCC 1.16607]|uniref:hypothetical protein n=1 Tax=Bacillus sp. CGMCC 1.16607 TaxID=3351842 RepID=UPI0036321CB8
MVKNVFDEKLVARFPFYCWLDEYGNKRTASFWIGEGWLELLLTMSLAIEEQLTQMSSLDTTSFAIYEVKEKYGGMRIDFSGSPNRDIGKLIRQAEEDSFNVCEECGHPGRIRDVRSWITVLCDLCNEKQ